MRRSTIVLMTAAVLLGACGGGYSTEFRTSFLASCAESSGGDVEYCQCVLDHLEANGPENEKEITSQDQTRAIRACLEEMRG